MHTGLGYRSWHRRSRWIVLPLVGVALLAPLGLCAQGIAINDSGAPPNPFALLDVQGSTADKGVLLPRMSSAQRTAIAGLTAAEEGLTVYDTTTKGYWYWDGAQWVQMAGGGAGWSLTGNAGTDPAVNFVGTTDWSPLVFQVNGSQVGELEGNFWANTFLGRNAGLGSANQQNVAVGAEALSSGNTGWGNSALGVFALRDNLGGGFNAAVGYYAMANRTQGNSNVAVGEFCMGGNNGDANVAIGLAALGNTAGSRATAIGAYAMGNMSGNPLPHTNSNVAVGYEALRGAPFPSANTGLWNTAVGYQAMVECSSGSENTAVGARALRSVQSGFDNCAFGSSSLAANTTGYFNTAVGSGALNANTTGYYNVAVGASCLTGLQTGWNNVAIGAATLQLADNSQGNIAIGAETLRDMSQGDGNIAIGGFALEEHQTGGNNIDIGGGALADNYTGTGNVAIGIGAGYGQQVSDKLFVQMGPGATPLIYGEFDTDMVRVNHNLGVGCSAFGGGTKVLALENGTPPVAPINGVLLYADEPSSELKVMDEAGNVTTLSPHHFSLMPRSEPMAWSHWSENRALDRRINVDMLRVVRVVERMSGERLVLEATGDGEPLPARSCEGEGEMEVLRRELRVAMEEIRQLRERVGELERHIP